MDWTSGKSASDVEWTLRDCPPDADRIWLSVTAREKMSTGWAGALLAHGGVRSRASQIATHHCLPSPTRGIVSTVSVLAKDPTKKLLMTRTMVALCSLRVGVQLLRGCGGHDVRRDRRRISAFCASSSRSPKSLPFGPWNSQLDYFFWT